MNSKNITVKSQVGDTVSRVEHLHTPLTIATHAYLVHVCVVQMEVEGEREKSKNIKEGVCVDDRELRTEV